MKPLTKEELYMSVESEIQNSLLEILEKICPSAIVTNRQRLLLIKEISKLLEVKE